LTRSKTFPPEDIVWVDESGANEFYTREYGLAPRGVKVYGEVSGKRYKRTNIVSAQCAGEVIAPCIYGWGTKSAWFEVWFEWHLCPELRSGKVVVMDNALFHRKPVLEKIAAFYGLHIMWLPPYSPDLNHIELLWANMKKWLRVNAAKFPFIQDAIAHYLKVA